MYAIIASGGKQEKVAKGQQVHVELLDAQEGSEVKFTPIMLASGCDNCVHKNSLPYPFGYQ